MNNNEKLKNLFEAILRAKVNIIDNTVRIDKEFFIDSISKIENSLKKEFTILDCSGIDISFLTEPYCTIIDGFFRILWGDEVGNLVFFYLYERLDLEGKIHPFLGEDQKEYIMTSPIELYDYIEHNCLKK